MHPTMMNLGEEEVNGKEAEVEMGDNCGELERVEGNAEERSDNDEGVEEEERTKKKTKPKASDVKDQKLKSLRRAAADYKAGKFPSIRKAAAEYGVPYTTLKEGIQKNGGEFIGSGRYSSRLSDAEEKKVIDHVKWRASVGYGVDWNMLTLVLQEIFLAVKHSNPERQTGLEHCGQLPNIWWVRRFAKRHGLVMRSTMGISKGRQVVTPKELSLWQGDI